MRPAIVSTLLILATLVAATGSFAQSRRETSTASRAFLATCGQDPERDCDNLQELKGVPPDDPAAAAAMDACRSYNTAMTDFCTTASDHEAYSREVMSAAKTTIAAKRDLKAKLRAVATHKPQG